MIKRYSIVILWIVIIGLMITGFFILIAKNSHKYIQELKSGIYDPNKSFVNTKGIDLEMIYISWSSYSPQIVAHELRDIVARGRNPVITIEPWPISASKYDHIIKDICGIIGSVDQTVYVRWGHEMELTGRYPWQSMKPADYISDYRNFVTTCKISAPQALFIWSPAGDAGLESYWPGGEYVDDIGLSVFSYGEFEKVTFGKLQSFTNIFRAKYNRVKGYGKPVMIAELGITGSREVQKNWINDLLRNRWMFPLLDSVIYFNAPDTVAWPKVGIPDWSLHTIEFPL